MGRGATTIRRTQEERRADTRLRLLEAATALLTDEGVDALSVDAVAAAAGRTSGAVYAHFGSKQGLLLALLDHWRHALVSVVAEEFHRSDDLLERLRAVAANVIVEPAEDTRRLLALERELWRLAPRHPEIAEALRARAAEAQRRMAEGFATWMAEGRITTRTDADTLAVAFRAAVSGLEMHHRLEGALDVDTATGALALVVTASPSPLERTTHAHRAL